MAFDRETQEAIKRMGEKASAYTPEMAQQELMEGVPQKGYLESSQAQQAQKMQSMGGDTALLSKALDKKMGREYDVQLNRAQRLAEAQSKLMPYEKSRRAMKFNEEEIRSLNRDNAIAMQRYNLAKEKEASEKEARASTLGSVLGVAGTAIGAAVGGPAGAMAGGSIGSGVGRTAAR